MISYAQNFEDVMLRRVFEDRNNGFYVDVGAMDPVLESVTKYFYDQGWSGINIEPNEWFYKKLIEDRPRDINLKVAVGGHAEIRPLHVFQEYGISTFDESNRDRFTQLGYQAEEKTVEVTTLAAVCEHYVTRRIDFLKVDCEGWEKAALEGADWDRFRPTIVIVEATEPGTTAPSWSEWQPLLEAARYEMVYFDGLNRFFLQREFGDLRCHFRQPPNIFDEFQIHATVEAKQVSRALQEERDHLKMRVAELETQTARLEAQLQENSAQIARLSEELQSAQARVAQLDQNLLHARLWVGQLSQELAANRRRLAEMTSAKVFSAEWYRTLLASEWLSRVARRLHDKAVILVPALLFFLLIVARNRQLFVTPLIEYGDAAVNAIQVQNAKASRTSFSATTRAGTFIILARSSSMSSPPANSFVL